MEYFSTSPFYDRQSNNQVLKMQSQFNALGDLNQRLSSMRGIEFIVHSEHPPDMWIIRKQRRNTPDDGTLQFNVYNNSGAFGLLLCCE
jgi:mediator of RNA polymerase II transcription subunit 6